MHLLYFPKAEASKPHGERLDSCAAAAPCVSLLLSVQHSKTNPKQRQEVTRGTFNVGASLW